MIIENESDRLIISVNREGKVVALVSSKEALETLSAFVSVDIQRAIVRGKSSIMVDTYGKNESMRIDNIVFNKKKSCIVFVHGGGSTKFALTKYEWLNLTRLLKRNIIANGFR